MDQFGQLEKASRNIDRDFTGLLLGIQVFMSEDGSWAGADGARAMDGIADQISLVRIFCSRARGTCELNATTFNLETSFLFLDHGTEYQINTWTPSRVTATTDAPCSTSMMTMDVKGKQVTAVTEPKPNCTGFTQAKPWQLVDGFSAAWKLNQDRMNQALSSRVPAGKATYANPKMSLNRISTVYFSKQNREWNRGRSEVQKSCDRTSQPRAILGFGDRGQFCCSGSG